jgi:hypothetical protein
MNSNDAGMQPVKLRSLTSRGALVPLNFRLGTSAAIVRIVPLLLVDLPRHLRIPVRRAVRPWSSGARVISNEDISNRF